MAYINREDVQAVRNALKLAFPKTKFSVTGGNSSSLNINIMSSTTDFSELWADREEGEFRHGSYEVNMYWYEEHIPQFAELIAKIEEIAKTAPAKAWFDKSDMQSDYFHTAYYINVGIGKWNKPYIQQEAKVKKATKTKQAA